MHLLFTDFKNHCELSWPHCFQYFIDEQLHMTIHVIRYKTASKFPSFIELLRLSSELIVFVVYWTPCSLAAICRRLPLILWTLICLTTICCDGPFQLHVCRRLPPEWLNGYWGIHCMNTDKFPSEILLSSSRQPDVWLLRFECQWTLL